MRRCERCGMPDTRPGSVFIEEQCLACINYDKRKTTDWAARWKELENLCRAAKKHDFSGYDCLIPVSGGKDSYTLCKIIVEDMGMRPLLCTVTDSFSHTKAGTHNLRNMIERFKLNHWQYTINHDLFRRATRAAFEQTGEPLKFVEYAIYTMPYLLAKKLGIPLVVFGENSAYEYGSTENDSPDANMTIVAMARKMESERAFWVENGVTSEELDSILPNVENRGPKVIFMSYYKPWSSVEHLQIAKERGFHDLSGEWDRKGTCENFEQIDSVAYMAHLWMKYPKFGFQRAADIASRRVREGLMTLNEALEIMKRVDPVLDKWSLKDFCSAMGYTEAEFWAIAKRFDKAGVMGEGA